MVFNQTFKKFARVLKAIAKTTGAFGEVLECILTTKKKIVKLQKHV